MSGPDRGPDEACRSCSPCCSAGRGGHGGADRAGIAVLDPSCIRFDDPNAVVNGEIVYAGFTAYELDSTMLLPPGLRIEASPSPSAKRLLPAMQCRRRRT